MSEEIRQLIVTPFAILVKGARKCQKPLTIFKALLENITEVLYVKMIKTLAEI